MTENTSSPSQKGRIFISYRRADSAGYAGRIYDRLVANFGEDAVFMDVDVIEGGVDFVKVLEDAVQSCDVLIALIGRQWLGIKDKDGNRRLDNPEDFVRIEIATALERNIRVIPVLVDGVDMPQPTELPENLKALARRNALQVNHHSFNPDVYRLIEHTKSALDEAEVSRVMKEQALRAARENIARERAAREKAENEAAEKARVEAEDHARQKTAQEKATREKEKTDAAAKTKREREERQATRKAALLKTISDFLVTLKSTLPKARPVLRVIGIIGFIVVLLWIGSWGIPKLASSVPTSKPTTTQRPSAQITSTSSPPNINSQASLNLAVHYVNGMPAENQISYNVQVYLSVVDDFGNPVRNVKSDAFSIEEDGQKVDIANLDVVTDEPVNIVIVMDTSGSMVGTGIADAKDAATSFISGLKPNDQVAILTFDDIIRTRIDFTTDRKTLSDEIALIDASYDAGSCIYDALYSAAQMASTFDSGRRAVILFTDGIDEVRNGAICSVHTEDDVIAIARVPIYTLGIGTLSDTDALERIADLTGGHYSFLPSSSNLANAFMLLSDQLQYQYILTYKSLSTPGGHTLTVGVNQSGVQDRDTHTFSLQPLPPQITFISPLEGEIISDILKITITLTSQDEAVVKRVAFEVNGSKEGEDATKPYEIELDATKFPPGLMIVSVIAYGENNNELARKSVSLFHAETIIGSVIASSTEIVSTPNPATQTVGAAFTQLAISTKTVIPTSTNNANFADDVGVPGLIVMVVALVFVIWLVRRLRSA